MTGQTASTPPPAKRSSRLRRIGVIVLLLGLGAAGALYAIRTRALAWRQDPMLTDYSKADTRQMEILYGKMGLMISDMKEDLKQPGTQAFLIAGPSVLVAFGCFLVARRFEQDEQSS
jgi:hypothetical protein